MESRSQVPPRDAHCSLCSAAAPRPAGAQVCRPVLACGAEQCAAITAMPAPHGHFPNPRSPPCSLGLSAGWVKHPAPSRELARARMWPAGVEPTCCRRQHRPRCEAEHGGSPPLSRRPGCLCRLAESAGIGMSCALGPASALRHMLGNIVEQSTRPVWRRVTARVPVSAYAPRNCTIPQVDQLLPSERSRQVWGGSLTNEGPVPRGVTAAAGVLVTCPCQWATTVGGKPASVIRRWRVDAGGDQPVVLVWGGDRGYEGARTPRGGRGCWRWLGSWLRARARRMNK